MKMKILIFIVLIMLGIVLSIPKAYAFGETNDYQNYKLESLADEVNITYNPVGSSSSERNFYIDLGMSQPPRNLVINSFDPTDMMNTFISSGTISAYGIEYETYKGNYSSKVNTQYSSLGSSPIDKKAPFFYANINSLYTTVILFKIYGANLVVASSGLDYTALKENLFKFYYVPNDILIIGESFFLQWYDIQAESNAYNLGAQKGYREGYDTAKNDFGLRNGVFGNADYWFSQGQLSEIDLWGSLLSAFFGVFAVLSIEILPGIELGYFVGFFLVLSVASMIIGSFMIRRK